MDITKYPQYHLYLMTLHFFGIQELLLPPNCDKRCVNATLINRAYYSAYLYCVLWLEDIKKFKPIPSWAFKHDEKKISKHKQIINALNNFGEVKMGSELSQLFDLRHKADYEPLIDIPPKDVTDAIQHMEKIFNYLKFE